MLLNAAAAAVVVHVKVKIVYEHTRWCLILIQLMRWFYLQNSKHINSHGNCLIDENIFEYIYRTDPPPRSLYILINFPLNHRLISFEMLIIRWIGCFIFVCTFFFNVSAHKMHDWTLECAKIVIEVKMMVQLISLPIRFT